jgi:hypothetical protein
MPEALSMQVSPAAWAGPGTEQRQGMAEALQQGSQSASMIYHSA